MRACTLAPLRDGKSLVCKAGLLYLKRVQPDKDSFTAIEFDNSEGPTRCEVCVVFQRINGVEIEGKQLRIKNSVSPSLDAYLKEVL